MPGTQFSPCTFVFGATSATCCANFSARCSLSAAVGPEEGLLRIHADGVDHGAHPDPKGGALPERRGDGELPDDARTALSRGEAADGSADLGHYTYGLVAEDGPLLHARPGAGDEVEASAADGVSRDADDGVIRVEDGRIVDRGQADVASSMTPRTCLWARFDQGR